ncbi:MAG: hypothetical protein ABIM89_14215 [Mycobacteriales bacterium]
MTKSSRITSDVLFSRHPGNPVLQPSRWPYTINAVMNAGATIVDGETVLVCRVEDRRGISHLTVARSRDGKNNWVVDHEPLLSPADDHPEEMWGVEDPRITRVDELDCWVIVYTAFAPGGPGISIATTKDFKTCERIGMVRSPEDKNGALLPRRVGGEYVMFHRPVSPVAKRADVWLSRSDDLRHWAAPEPVFSAREGGWWDSARIGMGAPPIETPDGWLVVYHGVRSTVAGALYRAGLVLLDLENPAKVLHRSDEWVLSPTAQYELQGDVPGVVFPCGLTIGPDGDELRLYYGAADSVIGMATGSLSDVVEYIKSCPAPVAH